MKARATPPAPADLHSGKVTQLHPRQPDREGSRTANAAQQSSTDTARIEAAAYIAQMTLELERLAATADLELLAYFLAMARAEAEANTHPPDERS